MADLKPSYFFDLSDYLHIDIFRASDQVWDVLAQIKNYLEVYKFPPNQLVKPTGVYFDNPDTIFIGKGTIIEPGAYIRGPCVIGKHCHIRHGAYVRGDVITGDHCVIGHDTEIKNSIMLNHTHAAHFAYIGDSILGNNVNLGAGVKCANLKMDNEPIHVYDNSGKKIETGLRKFGAIIGDHTQIGCNSVTNPGSLIGQNVIWYPCTNFGGFVPSDTKVKSNVRVSIINSQSQEKR